METKIVIYLPDFFSVRKLKMHELNRPDVETFRRASRLPVAILLDNVRSGNNVGSVFRTCDAFAVEKIFLCGITPVPPNREVLKTSLGSENAIEWRHAPAACEALEGLHKDYFITAIEQTDESIPLDQFVFSADKKYVFVFGNEVHGIRDDVLARCDAAIEIPQFGTKHSFNIAVSAGMVLWHFFLQHKIIHRSES
jgi:23S rRNA (guanosine2251-2'-O)-methyltransferase